ncbi:MarR family winged helix-turn-helix transcriptional regulator [Actibacterium sp. XHP0104]|uniref:MarR family winged helix-turn-helix transcriptional regulator n=1 Tax=Actibacterium sp. XHP0104 TaxID=2984335 RepID=UPI0021E79AE8|nr:MarR family transcriptional regulator [Actibacterium sp. XHP0104]MCV2880957.1 MarR family transcriptional regulator [Actibacterium sp. XHP0104]
MDTTAQIRALINRLARLDAAETWEIDLNPAQIAALDYLARANRFSRAPSHVAEYLGTTRGTMSQTLKSLVRKGYVTEHRSQIDKRSISYDLTPEGLALTSRQTAFAEAITSIPPRDQEQLRTGLSALLASRLKANGGRAFGICKDCAYHRTDATGAYCTLLSVPLSPQDTTQICHEQVAA